MGHFHLLPALKRTAKADLLNSGEFSTTQAAKRAADILYEGQTPGIYFDGITQMMDVIHVIRQLRKQYDIKAVGIFGSRTRREHRPLDSDIDLLVINDSPNESYYSASQGTQWSRNTRRRAGIADEIDIQETSSNGYRTIMSDPRYADDRKLLESVHWLWVEEGNTLLSDE